ncbi:MAG: hypothetical protein ACR2JY_03290 [Chloroflexota bacterium]
MAIASAFRRRRSALAVLAALLIVTACVGRPKETSGQFPSFLPSSGNGVSAVPTNVGGNSDTSGIGAGLLQSPGTKTSATPTPGK